MHGGSGSTDEEIALAVAFRAVTNYLVGPDRDFRQSSERMFRNTPASQGMLTAP